MRLLPGLALAALCAACSTTPAITVVATPNPVPGDGLTRITVTATATEGGSPASGATVHFSTNLGVFDNATGTGQLVDAMTDDQGRAVATMPAPRQGWGTITFSASFSSQGKEPKSTVQVPLVPSGGAAAAISFICTSHNVGAMVFNRQTDIHMLCRATALDASNHVIPHASVQTLSEAGSLDWLDDSGGVQEFVYTVRPDDAPPKDVMPCDPTSTKYCKEQDICPTSCNGNPFGPTCTGEPCWTDVTGITHNPRDAVATLVAAVPAIKGFDTFGEPFVDKNDNGVRDPDEPYIDYNGNGKYDPGDGSNREHMVWKVFRVIWSGASVTPPQGQGTNHDSFMTWDKPNLTLTAHYVDRNLNALAADGASGADSIGWQVGVCTGDAVVNLFTDGIAMDQSNPGILFAADTGDISAPGTRGTYTRNTDYSNTYTISGAGSCPVIATPARTYDPGAPNFEASGSDPDNGVGITVSP
ncbi:MAG: hypothetical protein ACXWLM_00990 [Myxococcales bacterium]